MLWHSGTWTQAGFSICNGRWETLICLWKDIILSFRYGNVKKSFSFAQHLSSHCASPSLLGSLCSALCMFLCVCSDMLMNVRQKVKPVWMSVLVCAPLHSEQNFFYIPPSSVSLVLYVFSKSPPDGNQLQSWLTGKQYQQKLHYSPLAPALPLLSSLLIFSLSHTVSLSLSSPKARLLTSNFKWA